jgi:hypothetical protein
MQRLSAIKDELEEEYEMNKMKLFLEYHKLLDEKIIDYL